MTIYIRKSQRLVQPWYFRAIARNNEVVAVSEGYATRWNAKRAARKVFPGCEIVVEK